MSKTIGDLMNKQEAFTVLDQWAEKGEYRSYILESPKKYGITREHYTITLIESLPDKPLATTIRHHMRLDFAIEGAIGNFESRSTLDKLDIPVIPNES